MSSEIFQLNKLSNLHDGKTVFFTKTDFLSQDFETIRQQNNPVILISGNSDYSVTEETIAQMPDNVYHWFCTNNLTTSDRITTIPIGLDNSFESSRTGHGVGWPHAIQKEEVLANLFKNNNSDEPQGLVYANFTNSTNKHWRELVSKVCQYSDIVSYDQHKTEYQEFISKILLHKMIVCPLGNAPQGQSDNHRIYETLYCNRVPIVFAENQKILYDSVYSKLPVVILDDVSILFDEQQMLKKYIEAKTKKNDLIKFSYWNTIITDKIAKIRSMF